MNSTMQTSAESTVNNALRARNGSWLNRFAAASVAVACASTTQLTHEQRLLSGP